MKMETRDDLIDELKLLLKKINASYADEEDVAEILGEVLSYFDLKELLNRLQTLYNENKWEDEDD